MVHQRTAILMMFMRGLLLVLALCASTACTDFATPAELTKPTVLAIVADPPLVATGGTSELSVVLAGPDGPMSADQVEWALVETFPGVPPFGAVSAGAAPGEATFTVPDPLPPQPDGALPVSTVQATVTAGEETIVVVKAMVVADLPSANPEITALAIGGDVVDNAVTVTAGATVPLDVGTEPAPSDDATYAWYSTVGEIQDYQSNPCELVVAQAPGEGWLFVVVRDGRGGVAWRGVRTTVESP
jgi:hypothetical protein